MRASHFATTGRSWVLGLVILLSPSTGGVRPVHTESTPLAGTSGSSPWFAACLAAWSANSFPSRLTCALILCIASGASQAASRSPMSRTMSAWGSPFREPGSAIHSGSAIHELLDREFAVRVEGDAASPH